MKEYFVARRKAFKPSMIQQAWWKLGLCPLNPDLFTPSDFASSHSSSTVSHTPSSFPQRMPHVPDTSSDDGMFDPSLITVDITSGSDTEYHTSDSESSSDSESESSVNEEAEEMIHGTHSISRSDQELIDLGDLSEEEITTPCPPSRSQVRMALRPLTISTPTLESISVRGHHNPPPITPASSDSPRYIPPHKRPNHCQLLETRP